jgi:aromatic ring hydroxylase
MSGVRTGRQYIQTLRDGRRVWHAGRRIEDVATHPGFAGTVRTLARLYDLQHSSERADIMATQWESLRISHSYLPPTTPEHLAAKRRNTEFWARETLGQMGRFPDFCAQLTVGLLDVADTLGAREPRFAENARAYHRYCAERDLCLTHALNDQFYDRSKRASEQNDPDLILRVVRETPDGPVVRGLRNLATLAPLSDEALVHPNRPRGADEADYALAFSIPMNAPGLSIICRDLYAEHADAERLPLSARFDEVDATLIFDDVLVPWERVFVYRDPELAAQFHGRISLWSSFSTLVRLAAKLELFLAAADLLTRWSGRANHQPTQVLIGRLIEDLEVLQTCIQAAETNAYCTAAGLLAPKTGYAFRLVGIEASDRAVRILQDVLTSSLVLTGGASDLQHPELGPYVERYFRGGAPSTRAHLRLLAVAADLAQSAFAARGQLYERLQSGEPDTMRLRLFQRADRSEATDRLLRFIEEGWDAAPMPGPPNDSPAR